LLVNILARRYIARGQRGQRTTGAGGTGVSLAAAGTAGADQA
jgi:hypothetical protein